MSSGASAGAVQALTAPRVNVLDDEARFQMGTSEALVTVNTTGSLSSSVHSPRGPLEFYADQTKLYDAHAGVSRSQPVIVTNGPLRPIHELWDELEPTGHLLSVVFSPDGLVAYPSQVPIIYSFPPMSPLADYKAARNYAAGARIAALTHVRRQLDKRRSAYTQRPPADVVAELTDEWGVSQLVVAKALGVTPTAVRKWRRGEAARPEHRDRLSQLAAFTALLGESVRDVGGWLEIPLSVQATVTPIDLFIGRQPELALLFAQNVADSEETLAAYAPDWRSRYASDPDYQVVSLADGSRSAIPRRER